MITWWKYIIILNKVCTPAAIHFGSVLNIKTNSCLFGRPKQSSSDLPWTISKACFADLLDNLAVIGEFVLWQPQAHVKTQQRRLTWRQTREDECHWANLENNIWKSLVTCWWMIKSNIFWHDSPPSLLLSLICYTTYLPPTPKKPCVHMCQT